MEIPFDAPDAALKALNGLGLTEDLAFSPDKNRLIIVSYELSKLLVLDIKIEGSTTNYKVSITNHCEISSSNLKNPHGIVWIDNNTVIVANRSGEAIVLAIPAITNKVKRLDLVPLQIFPSAELDKINSTDCIGINHLGSKLHEVLICSNSGNYVASYILDESNNFAVQGSSILLKRNLKVPDGVKFSHDSQWIAVCNHDDHTVFIYENLKSLNCDSTPSGTLHGVNYPHGITFMGENFIFVSDAGAPFIYGYQSKSGNWHGNHQPFIQLRIMDENSFKAGHFNHQEGGAKGLCLVKGSSLLAISCQQRHLSFIDLALVLPEILESDLVTPLHRSYPLLIQNTLFRALKNIKVKEIEMTKQIKKIKSNEHLLIQLHQEKMELFLKSSSWKITAPFRVIKTIVTKIYATTIK